MVPEVLDDGVVRMTRAGMPVRWLRFLRRA